MKLWAPFCLKDDRLALLYLNLRKCNFQMNSSKGVMKVAESQRAAEGQGCWGNLMSLCICTIDLTTLES